MFLSLIVIKIIKDIKFGGNGYSTYVSYVLFLIVFILKDLRTWAIGYLYSIFGLYYYLYIHNTIAYPTDTVFTLRTVELFYGDSSGFDSSSLLVSYLIAVPFFFYLIYVISFTAKLIFTLIRKIKSQVDETG
jgi:hypothetical protein